MQLSRRSFLMTGASVVVGLHSLQAGRIFGADGSVLADVPPSRPSAGDDGPVLIVCQLSGGNDGLNTIVPFGMGAYYDLRPSLGIKQDQTIGLTDTLGFNPNLKALKPLWDAGKVAVVQGVGYPNPNRSHFRSMEIWQTAQPTGVSPVGWMGRYLDLTMRDGDSPLKAVAVGPSIPRSMAGARVTVPAIESVPAFSVQAPRNPDSERGRFLKALNTMYEGGGWAGSSYAVVRQRGKGGMAAAETLGKAAGGYKPGIKYPQTGFGRELQLVSSILAGGLGSRLFWVTQGGFDEHAGEKNHHGRLMSEFADAVGALFEDLQAHNLSQRVVLVAYSEFGRRVKENASGGTDHGAAGPLFVIGDAVKGGFYGDHPSLGDLTDGDLKYGVDFRQVYATLLDNWLGVTHKDVLGQRFDGLGFMAATT